MCSALDTASAIADSASFRFLFGAAAAALAAASGPGSTTSQTAKQCIHFSRLLQHEHGVQEHDIHLRQSCCISA